MLDFQGLDVIGEQWKRIPKYICNDLIYFKKKYIPIISFYAYSIGDYLLNGFYLFSLPLRYFLPNLTDDEYYLILLNIIIIIFSFIYAYLFYIIHPNMFTGISLIQNTAYLQWFEIQRRRFQENHRAG
ncbi:unnamed protein product [Rotaria sordida]|uniref:Uncharacterized protein n=1 Tax=Rotaria sordida TaxID=392033 RepID=A0A819GVS3_9BILA|nr:unnamed protein product [Rotaria sordida]CAF3754646.1 unnamed protein product [Rotaria sordida]CAF3885889.1 unnamed protein product [Rotaria sordida]